MPKIVTVVAFAAAIVGLCASASAQLAVSSNDRKMVLDNGVGKVVPNPKPDTATIIDLGVAPPKVVAEIEVPGSVVGPPLSVAVSRDGATAYVASSMKIDGKDPTKTEADDRISVIDLKSTPPRVVGQIQAGKAPSGMSITPDGKWCGVVLHNGTGRPKDSPFYHDSGRLVIFRIDGMRLAKAAEAPIGHWSQGIAFSQDGKTILVQNMVEQNAMVFRWDGAKLIDTKKPIKLGGGGAAIRTAGGL